ncbi:MAG: hypothetical protein K5917_07700 [Clostridiales bacterium]|nr:hypothetical protein [Clostridiales bacterium]
MKFEYVYCTSTNEIVCINKAYFYYNNNKSYFVEKIKDSLVCPECFVAQVGYNNDNPPYFSTYPNAQHAPNCTYTQDALSGDSARDFLKSNKNAQTIITQMHRVLDNMLEKKKTQTVKSNMPKNENPTHIKSNEPQNPQKTKRLMQKSLNREFFDDDYDCFKIFYGKFNMEWEEKKKVRNIFSNCC